MSYSSTQSERVNFSATAGSYDAPDYYPDNTYVLAEGISNTGYGALVTYSLSDVDVYNLGVLVPGNYTVSVDGHTWDYTNWMLGGFSSFSVYNGSGRLLDTSYGYNDISFTVQSNDSYYVEVNGSYGLDKQYSLYYTYDGAIQVTNPNTAPVASDFTVTDTLPPPQSLPVLSDADRVFNWGESAYSNLFPEHRDSQADVFGYYARMYSNGDALGEKNNLIYYYDGGADGTGDIVMIGSVSDFLAQAVETGF